MGAGGDAVRPCILCGKMTAGSVGAAGIKRDIICQPCKDLEDGALAARVTADAKVWDAVMDKLAPTPTQEGATA